MRYIARKNPAKPLLVILMLFLAGILSCLAIEQHARGTMPHAINRADHQLWRWGDFVAHGIQNPDGSWTRWETHD